MIHDLVGRTVVGVSLSDDLLMISTKSGHIFKIAVNRTGKLIDIKEIIKEDTVDSITVDIGGQILMVSFDRIVSVYAEDKGHVIEFVKHGIQTKDKFLLKEDDVASGILKPSHIKNLENFLHVSSSFTRLSSSVVVNWNFVLGYSKNWITQSSFTEMHIKTPSFKELKVSRTLQSKINNKIKEDMGKNYVKTAKTGVLSS